MSPAVADIAKGIRACLSSNKLNLAAIHVSIFMKMYANIDN